MLYKFTLLLAMNEESNFPTSLLSPIICPVESCIPNVYEVVMICISLMKNQKKKIQPWKEGIAEMCTDCILKPSH